jgi:hypothetical protein
MQRAMLPLQSLTPEFLSGDGKAIAILWQLFLEVGLQVDTHSIKGTAAARRSKLSVHTNFRLHFRSIP